MNRPRRRAQTSVEFLVLLGFLIVVFSAFLIMLRGMVADSVNSSEREELATAGDVIIDEVAVAQKVNDGYARSFEMPSQVGGEPYTVEIQGGREVILNSQQYEHVAFLPTDIMIGSSSSGPLSIVNLITKFNGIIELRPLDGGVEIDYCGDGICNGEEVCIGSGGEHECADCSSCCGNGQQNDGEDCDFPLSGGGYNPTPKCVDYDPHYADFGGTMKCSSCEYDTENCDYCLKKCTTAIEYCKNPSCAERGCNEFACLNQECNNGKKEGTEACDDPDYGGLDTCQDYVSPSGNNYHSGSLACIDDCKQIDKSGCLYCGDGTKNGPEFCDGTPSISCHTWDQNNGGKKGYVYGDLKCKADCTAYDFSECKTCEDCGKVTCFTGGAFETFCISGAYKECGDAYCPVCVPDSNICQGDACLKEPTHQACMTCYGSCKLG